MLNRIQIKRLKKEIDELNNNKLNYLTAYQNDENLMEFYFLFYGQKDTVYDDGKFIGKLILNDKYPALPPDIIFLTPNGRFDIDKKICLSITGFHRKEWNPLLTIQNMLIQVYSVFNSDDDTGISHLKETNEKRIEFSKNSEKFNIEKYNLIYSNFNMKHLNNGENISS
jgi:ubiquitin-protein ligase